MKAWCAEIAHAGRMSQFRKSSRTPSHFPRDRRRFLRKSARVTHLSVRVESLPLKHVNAFSDFNFGSSSSATVSE